MGLVGNVWVAFRSLWFALITKVALSSGNVFHQLLLFQQWGYRSHPLICDIYMDSPILSPSMDCPFPWATIAHYFFLHLTWQTFCCHIITSRLDACLPHQTLSDLKGGIKSYLHESIPVPCIEVSPPQYLGLEFHYVLSVEAIIMPIL